MVGIDNCIKRELWLTLNQSILSEAAKIKTIINNQYNLFILGPTYEGSAWKFWASFYTQKQ